MQEFEKAFNIRRKVFIEEQNVPFEEEKDGLDEEAEHFLLYVGKKTAATCRLRILDKTAKIERVACLKEYRGLKLGKIIMEYLMDYIKNQSDAVIMVLGAQCSVVGFYEKLGFIAEGDIFLDAGIKHRLMKLKVEREI